MTRTRSLVWRTRGAKTAPGVRILFYHRIADEPDSLAVSPDAFRRQVEYLASQGFRIVDVPEAARLAAVGDTGRVVGMSFDDGYRDVVGERRRRARGARCEGHRVRGARRGRRHRAVQLVRPPAAGARVGRDRRARPRLAVPVRGPHGHPSQPAGADRGRGQVGDRLLAGAGRGAARPRGRGVLLSRGPVHRPRAEAGRRGRLHGRRHLRPRGERSGTPMRCCCTARPSSCATAWSTSPRRWPGRTIRPCRCAPPTAGCGTAATPGSRVGGVVSAGKTRTLEMWAVPRAPRQRCIYP